MKDLGHGANVDLMAKTFNKNTEDIIDFSSNINPKVVPNLEKYILEGLNKESLNWEITEADIGVDSGQCGIYDYESVKDIIGTGDYDEKDTFYGQACQCTDADEQYKELNGYGVVSRSGVGDGSYDLYIAKQDDQVVGFRVVYLNEDEEDEDI